MRWVPWVIVLAVQTLAAMAHAPLARLATPAPPDAREVVPPSARAAVADARLLRVVSAPPQRAGLKSRFAIGRAGRSVEVDLLNMAVRLSGGGFSARLKGRMAGRRFVELDPGVH